MKSILVLLITTGFAISVNSASSWAIGKRRQPDPTPQPTQAVGKHVIRLDEVADAQIELPDQSKINFGERFGAVLRAGLTQNFVVEDHLPSHHVEALSQNLESDAAQNSGCYGIHWKRSQTPVSVLRFHVNAMSFQTGTGGERMFYGFNERFHTAFNDGSVNQPDNEFPLRHQLLAPNFFDRTFDDRGNAPFDSRAGLDLGDGLNINVLFAWLSVKYAQYTSSLHVQMDRDDTLSGKTVSQVFKVRGGGYFYDVVGAYDQYSVGIKIARTDAMSQAMNDALQAAYSAVEKEVLRLPLVAAIDGLIEAGKIDEQPLVLLGTGSFAGIPAGTQYSPVGRPDLVLQVDSSCAEGSTARLIQGDWNALQPGMRVAETSAVMSGNPPSENGSGGVAGSEQSLIPVEIPLKNLPQARGLNSSNTPQVSWAEAFLKSLVETVMLPYRLSRYWAYDQTYHKDADSIVEAVADKISDPGLSPQFWSSQARAATWASLIGLDHAPEMAKAAQAPIVAVIDTGVDYNHPVIHDSLWLNPSPVLDVDGQQDRYGWDFISGDSRPYDDGYHGSEVASAVLAIAPETKIMALKVFNPFGITSSAALLGAFQYAVNHGARVILTAWSGRPDGAPQAIAQGIQYARDHGVLVVAAAGDRGHDLAEEVSYPAAFAPNFDNLIVVTSVTDSDQLVKTFSKMANFGEKFVTLAAPGEAIQVADPRAEFSSQTSTSFAAAFVAGALARIQSQRQVDGKAVDALSLKEQLLNDADVIPALQGFVNGGRRLRVRN